MKNLKESILKIAEARYIGDIEHPLSAIKALALVYDESLMTVDNMYSEIYQEVSTGCIFHMDKELLREFKEYIRNVSQISKHNGDRNNAIEIINTITYHWGGVKYWPRSRSDHQAFHAEILMIVVNQLSLLKCNTTEIWSEFTTITDKELTRLSNI